MLTINLTKLETALEQVRKAYPKLQPTDAALLASALTLAGRHALAQRYADLGYYLSSDELDQTYKSFTQLADRKKCIYDQDLLALLPRASDVLDTESVVSDKGAWVI